MDIKNISGLGPIQSLDKPSLDKTRQKEDLSFADLLKQSLNQVNELQLDSQNMKEKMILGEVDNLHDVSIAAEKANIALQVTMTVRSKLVEAYKDIIRLQI